MTEQNERIGSMFVARVETVNNGFLLSINGVPFVVESVDGMKHGFEDVLDMMRHGFYKVQGFTGKPEERKEVVVGQC